MNTDQTSKLSSNQVSPIPQLLNEFSSHLQQNEPEAACIFLAHAIARLEPKNQENVIAHIKSLVTAG